MMKLFPVIVSTSEGMQNAFRDNAKVVYVDERLHSDAIEAYAAQWNYRRAEAKKKRGILYLNRCIPDDTEYEIWDPLGIL